MEELMILNRRLNAENLQMRNENQLLKIACVISWCCCIISELGLIYALNYL